jgi:hypothetical protein
MLAVSLVGFAVYFLAIVGGPDTPAPEQPCGDPLFDSPVLAAVGITGITLTWAAVVTTWVVYLRVTSKLATVILAVTIVLCAMATFTPRVC